jgi:hypothetical protein
VLSVCAGLYHSLAITKDFISIAVEEIRTRASHESVAVLNENILQVAQEVEQLRQNMGAAGESLDSEGLISAIDGRVASLNEAIETRASQASVNDLGRKQDEANGSLALAISTRASEASMQKLSTQLSELSAELKRNSEAMEKNFDLALREAIEEHLADIGSRRNTTRRALFYMPQEKGGYLEFVRDIVKDSIYLHKSSNLSVGRADELLTMGNESFERKDYKTAIGYYAAAYYSLVTTNGEYGNDDVAPDK